MRLMTLLVLLVLCSGCGGGSNSTAVCDPNNPNDFNLVIAPTSVHVGYNNQYQFVDQHTSCDANVGSFIWNVVEGNAGGTIDQNGLYTAPAAAGTYHVQVTFYNKGNAVFSSAHATVTVP